MFPGKSTRKSECSKNIILRLLFIINSRKFRFKHVLFLEYRVSHKILIPTEKLVHVCVLYIFFTEWRSESSVGVAYA